MLQTVGRPGKRAFASGCPLTTPHAGGIDQPSGGTKESARLDPMTGDRRSAEGSKEATNGSHCVDLIQAPGSGATKLPSQEPMSTVASSSSQFGSEEDRRTALTAHSDRARRSVTGRATCHLPSVSEMMKCGTNNVNLAVEGKTLTVAKPPTLPTSYRHARHPPLPGRRQGTTGPMLPRETCYASMATNRQSWEIAQSTAPSTKMCLVGGPRLV